MEYILAPLDGFTNYKYRQSHAEVFGSIKKAVAPFVPLVTGKRVRYSHLKDLWPENNKNIIVEPQILGNEELYFKPMADALWGMGYKSLNWNLGCPVRSIAMKERGSGLLVNPERIDRFLCNAYSVSNIGISVKIRLGYKSKEEFWKVVEVLNKYPLKYVAIHPRTGVQGYEGQVDRVFFENIIPYVNHEIVYSGDIFSYNDAKVFEDRFPNIKKCMLGRGVLYNPALPDILLGNSLSEREIKEKCFKLIDSFFLKQKESMLKEMSILQSLKQYWIRFNRNDLNFISEEWIEKIKRVQSITEYEKLINLLWKNLD